MVFSIECSQEGFRYGLYRILRKTESGLQEVSDNSRISENKHILAYVSGLGFGIMSGAFSLVNILADAVCDPNREHLPNKLINSTFLISIRLDQPQSVYSVATRISS